jgi:phosphoglycolate phosphatase-like HAD superfamily hydrolase
VENLLERAIMKEWPNGQRAWDSYDVYLFDIDGTLLNCADAVHYFAFCSVLSEVAGREMNLDGVTAHGNTDIGIVRDALALVGIPQEAWLPRLAEVRTALCGYVADHEHELCIERAPGIDQALHHLREQGAVLGIVTGNLEQIGRLKLQHGGLLEYFDFGSYSDHCDSRSQIVAHALRHAREVCGENGAVCVVGDTPADIRAARMNGLDVIAVATGIYSQDQLEMEQPDRCVTSLQQLLPEAGSAGGDSVPR